MKVFRNVLRILVGIVFIFSGFVKGIDPMGTVFRMQDYFHAFGMPWADFTALPLTLILCTLEFVLGVSLLFNLWIKKLSLVLLPLMIYFTVLTFFDATLNIVPDCGCFGDAVKLTNLQTFLKNLVLMVLVTGIFMQRKRYKSILPVNGQLFLLLFSTLLFAGVSVYSYRHLPLIDFMSWKIGNQVNHVNSSNVKFYVTYKNKKTGEEKEFLTPNYPWNDSIWMSEWAFKSQRADDPNHGQAMSLRVEDERGVDNTSQLVNNPDLQFLFISYDLSSTDKDAFHRILPFYRKADSDGYSFVCLTSSTLSDVRKFRIANGTAFDFYLADDVVLKTMIRSNPGLILIKNGKVLAKWHYRDIPPYEEVIRKFKNP